MVWLSLSMTFRILSLLNSTIHHNLPFAKLQSAKSSTSLRLPSATVCGAQARRRQTHTYRHANPSGTSDFIQFADVISSPSNISTQPCNIMQYHAISLNISIEEFIKNYEATAAMLPYCQLHDSVGAQTHNFRRSPAPNSVEEHISRYARPTQNKSNHDQYQSGPHRNSLMLKTFLACSNMFKHAHQKLSKSTPQTHLLAVLYSNSSITVNIVLLFNELEWPRFKHRSQKSNKTACFHQVSSSRSPPGWKRQWKKSPRSPKPRLRKAENKAGWTTVEQFVVGWSLETYSSLYFTEKSWGFMIFMCKACMSQRFRSRPRTHTHKITQTRPLEQSARTSFKHSIYVPQNIRRNSLASMSVSLWILLMFGSHPIGMYPLTGFTMFHLDSQVLQDICQFI